MKNFIKKHKKSCIIGGILILLFLVFFVIVFIMPLFSNNKYGDRLEDIETHEVSKNTLNEITDKLKENEGVEKASYHKEGRILNFIVTVKNDTALDKAKAYTNVVTDTLNKKTKNYYDIEFFLTTKEYSHVHPVIGYHHKGAKEFSWSNVGEQSE